MGEIANHILMVSVKYQHLKSSKQCENEYKNNVDVMPNCRNEDLVSESEVRC